jgi:uncharacterized membrane protein YdjX (TVP38/TMEM64 family)
MATRRLLFAVILLVFLTAFYLYMDSLGLIQLMTDSEVVSRQIKMSGNLGPFLVISLMATAIVFNPIPSAPIALAAGAIYGHTMGTLYIVIGAEVGAITAFSVARLAGYDLMCRMFGKKISLKWVETQNGLTALVFISRLIPFISFDLVSYGAGLTPIRFWRFALATLLGLLPTSFLLAHFGDEMSNTDLDKAMFYVLIAGIIVMLPFIYKWVAENITKKT